MSFGAIVPPVVKPISVSLTSGDGVVRVPSLKKSPGGGCWPWVAVGLLAVFAPKRGSVVWGRAGVSPGVVSVVLHSPNFIRYTSQYDGKKVNVQPTN